MEKLIEHDGTTIGLNQTITRVRGGGFGSDAWVAKIVGIEDDGKLKREFCRKDKTNLSGSGRSGTIEFTVDEFGIYEFRNFCRNTHPMRWRWSGFFEILNDGSVELIDQKELVRRFTDYCWK